MTALTIIAYILGGLFLALLFAAEYIAVLVKSEERIFLETGRTDMYVSDESYEKEEG